MFRSSLSLVVIGILASSPVRAQSARDTLYSLPEVTVIATRFAIAADAAPARITRTHRQAITRAARRSVADVLENSGAGFVRRYGPGGLAGISLRGGAPSHTAILIDGHKVSDPQLGQVDLSLLPTVFVSTVEVLHGAGSSRYGSDAVAGAVNLSTLGGGGDQSAIEIATRAGAWGERSLAVTGSARGHQTNAVVAVELAREDGDFSFSDPSSFPSERSPRANADRQTLNLFSKVRHGTNRSVTEIAGWLMSGDRGLPTAAGSAPTSERQWDDLRRLWLVRRWSGVNGVTEVQASAQQTTIRYVNPTLEVDARGQTRSLTVAASRERGIGKHLRLRVGADLAVQDARHPALGHGVSQTGFAVQGAASASITRSVKVYPSVRADWLRRGRGLTSSVNPAVRMRVGLSQDGRWALKGGLERSFRAPTFNDLYWRDAGAVGNSSLVPEKGVSADVGLAMHAEGVSVEVTTFFQSIRNRIVWLPAMEGIWTPRNLAATRSVGVEIGASGTVALFGTRVIASSSYEIVRARDRSERGSSEYGQPLRYVPEHSFTFSADLEASIFTGGLSARAVGRRYITADASSWLRPYAVIDARVGSRIDIGESRLGVTLAMENIGSSDYEIISGYPMPPRHLRIQLIASFR